MRLRRVTAVLAVLVLAMLAFESWRAFTPAPGVRQGSQVVEIPPNSSVLGIAGRLAEAGVIRSPQVLVALTLVRGSVRSLKAGEYEFPARATLPQVLAMLESGRVRYHQVLHPEGATVSELARAVEAAGLGPAAEVQRVARDPAFLRAHAIQGPSAEGYLFPDTYYFVRGMTIEQMLGRMVQRLQSRVSPDLRARAQQRGLTFHQLLTLASIVEREAVAREERPVIAGVFWNRLKLGMPLQADPTVQYAAGKERGTLLRSDLQNDHPYNTYQRPGLPPGPIASPGLDAIRAAAEPAAVPYLYFVKKDDQHHHFSTTIEEHNRAVTEYRLARSR